MLIINNYEKTICPCSGSPSQKKRALMKNIRAKKKLATTYFRDKLSSAYKCLTSLFGMGRGVST